MGIFEQLFGKKRPVVGRAAAGPSKLRPLSPPLSPPSSRPQDTGRSSERRPGIDLLIKVCANRRSRLLGLDADPLFKEAVQKLKQEGVTGAQALASLIDELLAARCVEILDALEAAKRLDPQAQLINAIERIISAPSVIASQTVNIRFSPVIAGGGRMGWDDSTASRIKAQARDALRALGVEARESPDQGVKREESHGVAGATSKIDDERPNLVVTCGGCQKTYRLGVDAAVVTSEGVASEFATVIVVGGDKVTGGTKDDPDLVAPFGEGRSPSAKMIAELERLSKVRASGQGRYWRCNPCGKTNRYPW